MRFWKPVLVILLLVGVSNTTTSHFREVLNLKLLSRNEDTNYLPSYVAQSMISLFCKNYSISPGPALFRATVLKSIMGKSGSATEKGIEFEKMILNKSEGLLGGYLDIENIGPEPPFELLSLYNGNERKTMRKYLTASLASEFDVVLFTSTLKMENWVKLSISEAAISWKKLYTYFKYIRCESRVLDLGTDVFELNERMLDLDESISDLNTKLLNLEYRDGKGDIETCLNEYLNRYEKILKTKVFKFDFGCSHAKLLAVFFFFEYLLQISRVYAMDLSNNYVQRLQGEHREFIYGAIEFATNVATKTKRTFKAALPFDGWLYFKTLYLKGMLVPSTRHNVALLSQYANHRPLLKVSLYYVHFTPWNKVKYAGFTHIQEIADSCFELILHTSREDFDEVWLEKIVRRLSGRLTDHFDLIRIFMFPN